MNAALKYQPAHQAPLVEEWEMVEALLNDSRFNFKDRGEFLRGGVCPHCGKKELWVGKAHPWVVHCNRGNNCGYSETTRDLYPELFSRYAEKYPATPENPKATADAYLRHNRGFDVAKIRDWYEQERYRIPETGEYVETVRFYLDAGRTRYWERLIDKGKAHGQRINFGGKRKEDGSLVKGDWWMPPGQTIQSLDEVFLVEGIFHAIAFHLAGYKACALLMAGQFPDEAIQPFLKRHVRWRVALDDDPAGRKGMVKHRKTLLDLGEKCSIVLTGRQGKDWDDLYRLGQINDEFLGDCLWRGRMFTAETVSKKAWAYFAWRKRSLMVLDFHDALYSIKVDDKLQAELADAGLAITNSEAEELFRAHAAVTKISNCNPQFEYCEKNQLTGELFYYFHVRFHNHSAPLQLSLTGSAIESPASLNKALLNGAAGATFDGSSADLKIIKDGWFGTKPLHVEAVPFVGYDRASGCYLYRDFAVQAGRLMRPNHQGFFVTGEGKALKSSFKGFAIHYHPDETMASGWMQNFIAAYGFNGLTTLAFFFASLFAEQIRAEVKSFPFLELTGEPGSGKTTLLKFCWKLLGRDEEGFDPSKATFAARTRAFMQVANLPIVLIESDRGEEKGRQHAKAFDFDELKTAYNGGAIRAMGVFNRGNDIEAPPFRGSIVISQNAQVDGSEALLSRVVGLHTDCRHHTRETEKLAQWFETVELEELAGFLPRALKQEAAILKTWREHYPLYVSAYMQKGGIKFARIIKNHASIMAMAHALAHVLPDLDEGLLDRMADFVHGRAVDRQQTLNADHPIVQGFWETYELLNVHEVNDPDYRYKQQTVEVERLNHSTDAATIAVNLKQFYQCCMENKVELIPTDLLKKYLIGSKKFKYLGQKNVRSKILNKSIWCWIFRAQEIRR